MGTGQLLDDARRRGARRAILAIGGSATNDGGIGAAAPSNFSNEASGQDGGFLVPPQFSQEIFKLSLGEDPLLPLTDNVELSGNSMAFPKDETTP